MKGLEIGLYLDAGTIVRNPGYLEELRDRVQLERVILSFSGELPPEVLALSPFDGQPPSDEGIRALLCRHIDGRPSATKLDRAREAAGPHMHVGGDDATLRAAIRQAHDVGLEVWLLGGAWTASDFDVLMYCPGQERVNRWYEAVYTHLATAYGVEGLDITHARYPMTSYPRGMFLCTCEHCARAAAAMGYDMAAMTAAIGHGLERLRGYDGQRLAAIGREALGVSDVLQLLGLGAGIVQWFAFRAELLGRNLARFRQAVHAAAGDGFVFGADTYPASLATFVGHDQARWAEHSDFASPLVSHLDIFPLQTLTAWAGFLRGVVPGLGEAEALRMVYRFAGYDSLALPDRIADFHLGEPDCEFRNVPLVEMVMLDLTKASLCLPPDLPAYPIIQGGGAPHLWPRPMIDALVEGIKGLGYRGVMFQGTRMLLDYPLQA